MSTNNDRELLFAKALNAIWSYSKEWNVYDEKSTFLQMSKVFGEVARVMFEVQRSLRDAE